MTNTRTTVSPGHASSTTAIYIPGKTISTIESCSGQVRWEDGKLEQLWNVQHIGTTGSIEKITEEWRRVPSNHC